MNKKAYYVLFFIYMIIFTNNLSFGSNRDIAREIIINVAQKTLFIKKGVEIKEYPIAVGKAISKTPIGSFKVLNKAKNPYYKKLGIKGGSEENPLGSRWISFKYHYGIHGNNEPESIGSYASGGCIRMFERDVQEIYSITTKGTPVNIQYNPIKIMHDINGNNPIIKAHIDEYKNLKNYEDVIINTLSNNNLLSKLDETRIKELIEKVQKRDVVFSDKWCLFINKQYITCDIKLREEKYYVNKKDIQKYFNVDIYSSSKQGRAYFLEREIEEIILEKIKYVNIGDIQSILRGTLIKDDIQRSITLNADLININNKLLSNAIDITTLPKIPLNKAISFFDIDIKLDDNKIIISHNNKMVSYRTKEKEMFIDLIELLNLRNSKVNVSTYYGKIDVVIDPEFVCEDILRYGKIIDKNVYIPIEILLNDSNMERKESNVSMLIEDISNYVSMIDNVEYVLFDKVKYLFEIEKNSYDTKFILKRRN
ncbi:L,D-transpeptidase [Clostridiaceae bacterium M8S5]|nr:L,D-transpeptidase [Clostridiaceae bacterium M8S5]